MLPCEHSSLWPDARAPNQSFDMAHADQGRPQAALDTGDLWISNILPQHPGESHGQLPGRHCAGLRIENRRLFQLG